MKKHRLFTLATMACLLTVGVAQAQTLATVNGVKIPQSRLNLISKGQKLTPEQEKAAKEALIRNEILSQAAKKKNLQKNPMVADAIDFATGQVLASAYISDYARGLTVTDADLKAAYAQMTAVMSDKEYKVRRIVVATEAEANDVIAQLKRGERFATLAEQRSLDKESAAQGGQIGWTQPAFFGGALDNLAKGSFTQTAIKGSPSGYNIFLLEDTRPYKKPTFEEAKPKLENAIRMQKLDEHLATLRQQAKIQ